MVETQELLEATFEIEMSTDSTFMGDVPSSGGLPEDAPGELTWDSSVAGDIYTEDMVGYARARSSDPGGLASDWTVISFTPNVQNDPPTAPTLIAPIGGEEVEGEVELRIRNATDPTEHAEPTNSRSPKAGPWFGRGRPTRKWMRRRS